MPRKIRQESNSTWLTPPNVLILPEKDIHIWQISLNISGDTLQQFTKHLSKDEYSRAKRFHFENDRRRFVIGRDYDTARFALRASLVYIPALLLASGLDALI